MLYKETNGYYFSTPFFSPGNRMVNKSFKNSKKVVINNDNYSPSRSALFIIKLFKNLLNFSSAIFLLFIFLSVLGFYVVLKTKSLFLHDYYIGDASSIMMLISVILGIFCSFIIFIFFFILFLNRKGWLRKSKSHFLCLVSFVFFLYTSIFILYIFIYGYNSYEANIGQLKWTTLNTFVQNKVLNSFPKPPIIDNFFNNIWLSKIDLFFWSFLIYVLILWFWFFIMNRSLIKTLEKSEFYFYKNAEFLKNK